MGLKCHLEGFTPTTPLLTNKYNKLPRVTRAHCHIPTGQFCLREAEPFYLPPRWKECVHPEGNLYYFWDSFPKIVTDAYLPSSDIQKRLQVLIDDLVGAINDAEVTLPDSVEVFLELESDTCLYYMVDHATRTTFWLHPTTTGDLSLRPVVSDSHLRIQLEELYWHHVEYFPVHPAIGFNLMVNELTDAVIQGRADGLMSTVSTFPYNAEECSQFLKLLKFARQSERTESVETKWSLARLWTMILNTRFEIHYGQEHCRLSRDQGILDISTPRPGRLYRVVSILMWGVPSEYITSLEKLWVDEVVYGVLWRQYITLCLKEWTVSVAMSFSTMIFNLLLLTPSALPWLMIPAVASACTSAFSGVMLLYRFHPSTIDSATQAAQFMTEECKEDTRFQLISFKFSLPRALLLWALTITLVRVGALQVIAHRWGSVVFTLLAAILVCGFLFGRLAKRLHTKLLGHRLCSDSSQLPENIV